MEAAPVARRLSRALATVAVFVLVGPLVGAVVLGVLLTTVAFADTPEIRFAFLYAAIAFFPLAYLAGGAQALFVGVVTAAFAWARGSAPAWVPAAAALAGGGIVASRSPEDWRAAAILIAVHVLPALACWALLRLSRR